MAVSAPAAQPCCHPVSRCQFKPQAVAWMLRMIDDLAQCGISPADALASVLSDRSDDHRAPLGPGVPNAAVLAAELSRAFKAGHRDPVAISRFLCPFGECDD